MNKIYLIIIVDTFEFNLIEFNQITAYKMSNDGLKIMIVYESEPSFFSLLTTKQGPYNENEVKTILETPNWITP
jgi:hypothetical protein